MHVIPVVVIAAGPAGDERLAAVQRVGGQMERDDGVAQAEPGAVISSAHTEPDVERIDAGQGKPRFHAFRVHVHRAARRVVQGGGAALHFEDLG
jgi:hypothetical protein